MENDRSYDDIIDLPHHVSRTRTPMSMHDRAAQFSPFAALAGFDGCIDETARITGERREITEDRAAELNRRIAYLTEHAGERPTVRVKYFVPDEKKDGGRYAVFSGNFKRIDEAEGAMIFTCGERIFLGDIYTVEAKAFGDLAADGGAGREEV